MADYSWIGPLVGAGIKGINSFATADKANGEMQAAYEEMLRNLQARMGDYDSLGKAGYQNIAPQQLGPSALEGVQADPAARAAQEEAMAALSELAANGGLSLADMQALNEIQGNLSRNNSARSAGLANQFAARGQLGAGAQLGMGLQANSDAAMSANRAGESAAAQAQARALDAILKKGSMGRAMGNDDWQRKAATAQAHDLIEQRNAAARTDASKYNNSLAGQGFEDELAKARGKTQLTGDMNSAVFGRGAQSANTTLGKGSAVNGIVDSGSSAFSKMATDNAEGDSDPDVSTYDDEDDSWNNGSD